MHDLHTLLSSRPADLGVRMAEVGDTDTAGKVEVAPAVAVVAIGAIALGHDPLSDAAERRVDVGPGGLVQVLQRLGVARGRSGERRHCALG